MGDEGAAPITYEFTCPRCHFVTDHKPTFKRHVFRGRSCKPSPGCRDVCLDEIRENMFPTKDRFMCSICTKGYNSAQGLQLHCLKVHKTDPPTTSKTKNINNGTVVNGDNANVAQTNFHTHIHMPRNFGEEDVSYISKEYLTQIAHCFSTGLAELMRNVHFHPEHPENHNVRLACKRDKIIEKVKDGKWVKSSHDQIEKAMVNTGSKMVLNCMVQPEFMQKYQTLFDAMMDDYVKTTSRQDSKIANEARTRLYVMILDETGNIQYLEEENQ
jgi:hypothetical protein